MPLDTRQWDSSPLGFEDIAARSLHPGIPLPELQAHCLQPPPLQCSHDKESCGKRFSRSELRSWCAAATATTTPQNGGALESSSQKRLLIFDQSGSQTRLLRCPFPLRFPSAEPVKLSGLEKGFKEDKEFDDENHSDGQESEMQEDTEEINALLYSDDDDDDDCESDDEVMSTGHSPDPLEQVCNNNKRESEEEEIDGPHRKKQKLLNISDSSSLVGTKSSKKLNESSFLKDSNISTKEDTGSGLSNEQSRKDKIRTALKILESVIPGAAKGNEALVLLDEAIDYLKSLKQNLISVTEIKN